jgi:hypothetical protein
MVSMETLINFAGILYKSDNKFKRYADTALARIRNDSTCAIPADVTECFAMAVDTEGTTLAKILLNKYEAISSRHHFASH